MLLDVSIWYTYTHSQDTIDRIYLPFTSSSRKNIFWLLLVEYVLWKRRKTSCAARRKELLFIQIHRVRKFAQIQSSICLLFGPKVVLDDSSAKPSSFFLCFFFIFDRAKKKFTQKKKRRVNNQMKRGHS